MVEYSPMTYVGIGGGTRKAIIVKDNTEIIDILVKS
jgi:hypothetical protein